MTEDIGEFGNVRARATQTPTHQRNINTRKIRARKGNDLRSQVNEAMEKDLKILPKRISYSHGCDGIAQSFLWRISLNLNTVNT